MRTKKEPLISHEIVESAIERVNKKCYLGSSNHEKDPSGGLSGYYLGLRLRVTNPILKLISQEENWIYLEDAFLSYTGAGNCGELVGALYFDLFLQNLSVAQKKSLHYRSYIASDVRHLENSYLLAEPIVYDIWENKIYDQSKLRAQTGVVEKKHRDAAILDPTKSNDFHLTKYKEILTMVSNNFDKELAKDRKDGVMYATFDGSDKSDYALFAHESFPYLYKKYKETIEDSYFQKNPVKAILIQGKIIRDFVYLVEELRQDIPAKGLTTLYRPHKIKYTHEQVAVELNRLIPHQAFVNFILAISYQNTNEEKALELLREWKPSEDADALEIALRSRISAKIEKLMQSLEAKTALLNPHQFFADDGSSNDKPESYLNLNINQEGP